MREQDVRQRIESFLKRTARDVIIPASMGLSLGLSGCSSDVPTINPEYGAPHPMLDASAQEVGLPDASMDAAVPDVGVDAVAPDAGVDVMDGETD